MNITILQNNQMDADGLRYAHSSAIILENKCVRSFNRELIYVLYVSVFATCASQTGSRAISLLNSTLYVSIKW